jgi:hypothetical protein
MTEERWLDLRQKIISGYTVLDQGEESTAIAGEKVNFIEWEMPGKEMRAEYHTRPKVLEKKTFYSNRIGSDIKEEFVYSNDEQVSFAKFFQKNSEDMEWQEIEAKHFL